MTTELDSADSIPRGFLSFSLVSQEIISVLFAFYSYYQGDMDLATFYLAMAALLLVGLGIHSIFDRPRTARLVMAAVMIGSYFYLLSGASICATTSSPAPSLRSWGSLQHWRCST